MESQFKDKDKDTDLIPVSRCIFGPKGITIIEKVLGLERTAFIEWGSNKSRLKEALREIRRIT